MSLFSKPKAVLWPRDKSVEVYLDKKENNIFSCDLDLFSPLASADIQPLSVYLKQQGINKVSVLVNDNLVFIRSFIYDSQITSIEKEEVIKLAESFVNFKINPESIEYSLIQEKDKTIIRSVIFDHKKIDVLKANLVQLGLTVEKYQPVSSSVATVISAFSPQEYFLIYPISQHEHTLILSRGKDVYLTSVLKGNSLDIQKIINYSNLYFSTPTKKIFLPSSLALEVNSTAVLEKTPFNEAQIATDFGKSSNLPLPVIGLMVTSSGSNPAIINTMESKKNILPIIAVFIFTAALASIIIWFVLNRSNSVTSPAGNTTSDVTPTVEVAPTDIPTPTVTTSPISKKLKLQVLNATSINGQAATLKEKLTALGFTSVTVGNSTDKTATANTISYKTALASVPDYFKSTLGDYFPATYTADLKTNSTYDVVLTIGTDLSTGGKIPTLEPTIKTTPTPTKKLSPTPTPTE